MSTPKPLIRSNQNEVFVQNQNTFGSVPFTLTPVVAGHTALLLVQTATALTDAILAEKFADETSDTCVIIAQDNLPSVTGYVGSADGRIHIKYTPEGE